MHTSNFTSIILLSVIEKHYCITISEHFVTSAKSPTPHTRLLLPCTTSGLSDNTSKTEPQNSSTSVFG